MQCEYPNCIMAQHTQKVLNYFWNKFFHSFHTIYFGAQIWKMNYDGNTNQE